LILHPAGDVPLQTAGNNTISVEATGYNDAEIVQLIDHGKPTEYGSSEDITPDFALNTTSTLTVTAKDFYENPVYNHTLKFSLSHTDWNGTTNESYTVDGTPYTSTASCVDFTTATNLSGVASIDISIPAVVDQDDGFEITVKDNSCNDIIVMMQSFTNTQVTPEPTNHVSTPDATADSHSQITTTWGDNDGAQAANKFLIVARTSAGSYPSVADGTEVADDTDLGDGNGAMNVDHGVETYAWTSLSFETQYLFKIYPYTNSGANIDFKTSPDATEIDATTDAAPTPLYTEDFEDNISEWTFGTVGQTNRWYNNTATYYEGSKSAYISNDAGTSAAYDNGSESTSWLEGHIDLSLVGSPSLSFWWKCEGETAYDFGEVYINNNLVSTSWEFEGQSDWIQKNIDISSYGEQVIDLQFKWLNDGSGGSSLGFCVDKIEIFGTELTPVGEPSNHCASFDAAANGNDQIDFS